MNQTPGAVCNVVDVGAVRPQPSRNSMRLLVTLPIALAGALAFAAPAPSVSRSLAADDAHRALEVRGDTIGEYRGTYETGFEVSWFHPCGAPPGDDRWWVTLTDAALKQRDSLAKQLTGQPRAVYVRWRGTVSPKMPAGTGHMGRGSRYLLVTEILQLRAAADTTCSAA
jgi:hypothetical protein